MTNVITRYVTEATYSILGHVIAWQDMAEQIVAIGYVPGSVLNLILSVKNSNLALGAKCL